MLNRRQLIASGAGLVAATRSLHGAAQQNDQLQINSTRYIATNADTGAIFAQRDAHKQVAIASLTKVFTAMEALNIAPLSTQITTTEDDMQNADATVMGFGPGETFSLEELVYGMMLPSGNDAAHAIARSLGSQEGDTAEEAVARFMTLVNQRVQLMGLKNTNLINPDGWGVPDHYSSAADVAAFMAYASSSDFLMTVMGTRTYTTSAGYQLTNSNKVLGTSPSVFAGKTGYDWDSGWCLVQIAERNGTRIVAVTLDGIAPDDWYNDNLVLLDFGFEEQTALGSQEFSGEFVTWSDPTPALFAAAGGGEVTITSESTSDESDEVIVKRETRPVVPERIAKSVDPVNTNALGRRGSGAVAGVGAAILAGAMGATRWMDLGGDRTSSGVRDGFAVAGRSIKRSLPYVSGLAGRLSRPSTETAAVDTPDEHDSLGDQIVSTEPDRPETDSTIPPAHPGAVEPQDEPRDDQTTISFLPPDRP